MSYRYWLAFVLLLGLVACTPKTFPGTKIPDNEANRGVLDVVSKYQKAMEERDLELLLDMASPDYYEDRGTRDQSDDYGLDELRAVMSQRFSNIQQMRYTVKIKDLKVEGDEAHVDFHYDMLFQFKVGDAARWNQAEDDNRLEMKKIDGAWKIRAGL